MHVGLRSNCAPSLRKINFLNLRANAKKLHGPALKQQTSEFAFG